MAGSDSAAVPTGASPDRVARPALVDLLQAVRVPHVTLRVERAMHTAVRTALTLRQAVALIAARGDGKSTAAHRVREQVRAADAGRLQRDPSARPMQIVHVPRLTAERDRGAAMTVLTAISPRIAKQYETQHSKKADDLIAIASQLIVARHVALITVDEAESCRKAGMAVLRAILTETQRLAAEAEGATDDHGACGVGMVLLGTPSFRKTWDDAEDTGGRRATAVVVAPLSDGEVAGVYRRILPSLEQHITSLGGRAAWSSWVNTNLTKGTPRPLRVVFNHALEYIRLMLEREYGQSMRERRALAFTTLRDCPFELRVFLEAWATLQRDPEAAAGHKSVSWYKVDEELPA